ncbi:hypothetical protein [Cellulophaga sp. Hel_I_12]|jgi:hypothetical protein|nr:hypothetical protein [Cellulophaga sp. Hel_I_12]
MEDVTISTKVLNGFLTLMVGVLVIILIGVVICLILAAFGFF